MDKEKEKLIAQEVEIRYFTQLRFGEEGFISYMLFILWVACLIALILVACATLVMLFSYVFIDEPDAKPTFEQVGFLMKCLLGFGVPAYFFRRLRVYLNEKKRMALLKNRLSQFHKKHGKQLKEPH